MDLWPISFTDFRLTVRLELSLFPVRIARGTALLQSYLNSDWIDHDRYVQYCRLMRPPVTQPGLEDTGTDQNLF